MKTSSIKWYFEQSTLIPIVRVRGTTTEPTLLSILLTKSVELIEKANEYDGAPIFSHELPSDSLPLMVSFTLIFKSHKRAQEFLQTLK